MSNQLTWKIVRGTINDHLMWVENNKGIKALFKQPRDQSVFKLTEIANELIVNKLAIRLGIPVSQTYVDYIDSKIGILSIICSESNWGLVTSQNLQNKVQNIDSFRQLFAFDVWIANTDRAGRIDHVIVTSNEGSYSFYAIDHGHTLNGCTQGEIKWQKENVNELCRFPVNAISHLSEPEIKSFNDLESIIRKIEELLDGSIDNIVDETRLLISQGRPQDEQQSLETNSEVIKALLKYRRDNLRALIKDWCIAKGKPVN
jgi:hypothetical protein